MPKCSPEELRPKDGHTLMVAIGCRISGCADQKEASLDDQEDNAKERVEDMYEGPARFDVIATKAKGERLDRPELDVIEAAYESGKYDLVIFDDIGRLIRGGEAVRLLGIGVDRGTRTICIGDNIDTTLPTWEEDALNACAANVAHNERTSLRIKQKNMNRFKKFGGSPGRPIAGYFLPPGAKTYDDWEKVESATPIVVEAARRLLETPNCTAVGNWLDSIGYPVGPYCRGTEWTGAMVRRYFGNPLLCGRPRRGAMHTVKTHGTGRRISQRNPKGPTHYEAPHLAHLDRETFDLLEAALAVANAKHQRPRKNGRDPLQSISRKRSRFPGHCACCWYCGRAFVWGGNGITDDLMCSGSRERRCWNSVGFDGPLAATRLVDLIASELYGLDRFADQFGHLVATAQNSGQDSLQAQLEDWHRRSAQLEREKQNVEKMIRAGSEDHPFVMEILSRLKKEEQDIAHEKYLLESRRQVPLELPASTAALRQSMQDAFARLACNSLEFGDLMRLLIPEFHVYLVRLCDGGHLLPRAKVKLNLGGSVRDVDRVPGLAELLNRELTIDLFESPPQRERIREEVVRLVAGAGKLTHREIAQRLTESATSTAVGNALNLHRTMLELNLSDPYVVLLEPPSDYNKLRRHKHPKYRFEPLDGYERPSLRT